MVRTVVMIALGVVALSASACASTPAAHSVVGTVQVSGRQMGLLHGTEGRCQRERSSGAGEAVRLTFRNESSRRLTVIDVPYERAPTHVDLMIASTSVTLTHRVCSEFDAHVRLQTINGNDGSFASGTLHLSCKLPAHEEELEVTVDFEQC